MTVEKDTLFGRLAVERGYVTQAQLDEASEGQRVMEQDLGIKQTLSQVMVGKGLLTPDQAQDLDNAVAVQTGEAALVGGYQAVAKLGQGGMGAVYKAKKLDTGELVALKILLPSLATPEYVRRFERESEVVRKLHHENIVGCVEFGRDERRGLYFCALEFIEGENLEERVEREGVLPEGEATSITFQITRALQHAHFNGLIHRDIKPGNIMVTPDGTAKLLDLGLARPVSQEATRLTQSGMFVGSPYYASPEQARTERDFDIRSDIYSLGATLYYMVTGHPPFEGETILAVLQAHVYEQIQWPSEVNPEVSEGLCEVIAKMMAKDPADRYQTPIDLLRDLDSLKEGRRPDIGEKVRKGSTIAPLGVSVNRAAVKRRRARPASRDRITAAGAGTARREGDTRETRARYPVRPARRGAIPAALVLGLGAAAALVIVLGLVFALGGRKEKPVKLPPVSERGHDTGAARSARSARRAGRGTRTDSRTAPVRLTGEHAPLARTAASAFRSAEDYERAHPDDRAGAIEKYDAVTRAFPGTVEAGKARINVIRLGSVLARQKAKPKETPPRPAGVPAGAPKTLALDLGGAVTMEFVYIKPGVFVMGGNEDSKHGWQGVEKPKHQVAITRGFYIGRYEVTRGQFAAFVKAAGYVTEAEKEGKTWGRRTDGRWGEIAGANWRDPVVFAQTNDHPVMCVSWNDVKAFCDWAAAKTRRGVRLPTEAEWEYACRAGTTTRFSFGDSEGALGEYAWHDKNSNWQTHPVGQKKPNAWGLHDMHGNVWEWVADWYDAGYYAKSPRENPTGPDAEARRLLRGGSWRVTSCRCRSAFRHHETPSLRNPYKGVRACVSSSPRGK